MPDACLIPPRVHDGGHREEFHGESSRLQTLHCISIHQRCTHHHSYTYRSVAFCDRHSQRCLPTFVSPTATTAKFHLLCYAHGIGTDSNRLAHLTVPRNVVKASANEYPDSETSLAEYCVEVIIFSNKPAVLSVKTQAAFLHRSRHVSHAD